MSFSNCVKRYLLVALVCVTWILDQAAATSYSVLTKGRNNTTSHHEENDRTYHRLRSPTTSTSSNGGTDSSIYRELKEIVTLLSQKVDDLEAMVQSQDKTIKNLESEVGDATAFHRYLQSDESDCLPKLRITDSGPRCDFKYVTRFQNLTYFNDDVVFKENVEFDSDANCMPTYNKTTRMCHHKSNFTFDDGDIRFEDDVRFTDTVKFDGDASFRDEVEFRYDVEFKSDGEVHFNKPVEFTENVLIDNEDHDIDFKLDNRVKARFYQDRTFEVDTHTTFYEDVTMKEDLHINKKLEVDGKSYLDDLELDGYLKVDEYAEINGELRANHRANVKGGLFVQTGGLDVQSVGAKIAGDLEMGGTFRLHGDGFVDHNFNVAAKTTTSNLLVDPATRRNLALFTVPTNPPVAPPSFMPIFEVKGDANIAGTLKAEKLYGDGVGNLPDVQVDINIEEIAQLVLIFLQEGAITVENINVIVNNQAEQVLTKSLLLELLQDGILDTLNLIVGQITANSAVIDGSPVSGTASLSPADIVSSLQGQNLQVSSISATTATVGGETIVPGGSGGDMTGAQIAEKLKGESLTVSSITSDSLTTNAASIGDLASSPQKLNLDDLVSELRTYDGEVTIPNLVAVQVNVESTIDSSGGEREGRINLNGKDVATSVDLEKTNENIRSIDEKVSALSGMNPVVETTVTQEEILSALQGASLSVSSLSASSIVKGGEDIVTQSQLDGALASFSAPTDTSTCTCDASMISPIVDSIVNESYIQGFINSDYIEGLGFSKGDSATGSCVCTAEDISSVLGGMDIGSTCTCTADDVGGVIDSYGFITANDIPSCECSVTETSVESQIMSKVNEYVEGSCPCDDGNFFFP